MLAIVRENSPGWGVGKQYPDIPPPVAVPLNGGPSFHMGGVELSVAGCGSPNLLSTRLPLAINPISGANKNAGGLGTVGRFYFI